MRVNSYLEAFTLVRGKEGIQSIVNTSIGEEVFGKIFLLNHERGQYYRDTEKLFAVCILQKGPLGVGTEILCQIPDRNWSFNN